MTISIIMGSASDLDVMRAAQDMLVDFQVPHQLNIVSAHRTPEKLYQFARSAHNNNIQIIIAGAGGAAHLPGMVAAMTHLPVIGVPVRSSNSIAGIDSLLSIVQMPQGIPVATVAINAAANAALLAIQILAIADTQLSKKIRAYRNTLKEKVQMQDETYGTTTD